MLQLVLEVGCKMVQIWNETQVMIPVHEQERQDNGKSLNGLRSGVKLQ